LNFFIEIQEPATISSTWLASYLILCKTHLDNSIWIVRGMMGISVIGFPAIEIWGIFTVSIAACYPRQQVAIQLENHFFVRERFFKFIHKEICNQKTQQKDLF
jgi:hypothetical protein